MPNHFNIVPCTAKSSPGWPCPWGSSYHIFQFNLVGHCVCQLAVASSVMPIGKNNCQFALLRVLLVIFSRLLPSRAFTVLRTPSPCCRLSAVDREIVQYYHDIISLILFQCRWINSPYNLEIRSKYLFQIRELQRRSKNDTYMCCNRSDLTSEL
jgi:hypothetical protein